MRRQILRIVVLSLVMITASFASTVDPVASYTGVFNGASGHDRMAQEFEISIPGQLDSITIYGCCYLGPGTFVWVLRDATDLAGTNIDSLPIIATGSGNFPSGGSYENPLEIELFSVLGLNVSEGDRLLLEVQQQTAQFYWFSGWGSLPGEHFDWDSQQGWHYAAVQGRERSREVFIIPEPRPDLIVSSLTIDKNPIMQPRGATISCAIKNQGDIGAANFRLRIMLSDDTIYDDPGDTYVAGRQITVNLGPGATKTEEFNFNSEDYSTGAFYLVAKVDAFEIIPESSENNNTKASDPVAIIPFTPHTIQGYVKYSTGQGFGGVQVNLTGDEAQTDVTQNDGWYNFDALADGNFTVTAVESGCTFTNNPQTAIVSGVDVWLLDMIANCVPEETISKPGAPSGETSPVENNSYTYTTSGATSSLGHTVEYQFDWDDGSFSGWSTSASANHAWTSIGERAVTVTARCQIHTDKTNISDPLVVTVVADEPPPPAKLRLIIDTDPAVGDSDPDDGTALIYALRSSDLCTVEGITYGFGNFGNQIEDVDGRRGTGRMLDYYQLQINKVLEVLTEAKVIIDSYPPVVRGHEMNDVWDNNDLHLSNSATNFITDMVKNNPNEITIVALGTLTNIATAMEHYNNDRGGLGPEAFLEDCNSLWIIGGGVGKGNVWHCVGLDDCSLGNGEYNIWRDRKAAEYVFSNAIAGANGVPKIKMVPLNATMRWLITLANVNSLPNSRLGKYLKFPLLWWMGWENNADNRQTDDWENWAIAAARTLNLLATGFPPYDTIGMAIALEPEMGYTGQIDPNDEKIVVNLNSGETVVSPDANRGEVRIFYDYNEPNMVDKILTKWTKCDLPFGPQKKFIDCSGANYFVRYYDPVLGYQFSGPWDVSSRDVWDTSCPETNYYHLPVGSASFTPSPSGPTYEGAMYRGRLIFSVSVPANAIIDSVRLHTYCDTRGDHDHRISIYAVDAEDNNAVSFWNSVGEQNEYVRTTHIGTLQAWRTVNLGNKAISDIQDGLRNCEEQFAVLLAEDNDDYGCALFDTFDDWNAYLEVQYDLCPVADFDHDCQVDFKDFSILANQWFLEPGCPSADIAPHGGDDLVNYLDLAEIAEHWLEGTIP